MPTIRKAITFSMPPEMAEQVQQVLKEERRSMSEFLRDASRRPRSDSPILPDQLACNRKLRP